MLNKSVYRMWAGFVWLCAGPVAGFS